MSMDVLCTAYVFCEFVSAWVGVLCLCSVCVCVSACVHVCGMLRGTGGFSLPSCFSS